VFLDSQRLQYGEQFQEQFTKALANSLVVVPLITSAALQRMTTHDANTEDNVLIEWIVAKECFMSPKSRVAKVFPFLVGERDEADPSKFGNYFTAKTRDGKRNLLDALPEIKPVRSIEKAKKLLRANGIEPSADMDALTVRSIVKEPFLGFCSWEVPNGSRVVASFAGKVWQVLQDALKAVSEDQKEEPTNGHSTLSPSSSSAVSVPAASQELETIDVTTIKAFLHESCGIGVANSQRYAEELVTRHNVSTVKRMQQLHKKGKLAAIMQLLGMSEDDSEALLGELEGG
jgi:hypothetical protein